MTIKVSDTLNIIINFAREEAMRTGCFGIGPDHLLLGILRHGDNPACEALKMFEVDLQELKQFIDSKIFTNEHISYSEQENISFSRASHNILSLTVLEASKALSTYATEVHLILALSKSNGFYGQSFLREHGVDYGRLYSYMSNMGLLRSSAEAYDGGEDFFEPVKSSSESSEKPQEKKKQDPLSEFGYDMTAAASTGVVDPVVGRDEQIERVIRILGRRKKNNPILIGEPGVGKSAIVEGIAQRIASGDVALALKGRRIISLDIGSVVAGTRYRGDFEKRLKAIIAQISKDPDIILFIDEFHTIIGAGSAGGSLDAANMLKPALARGEIQCIAATTLEEYRKTVEKDGALDRRFQKVVVEPADVPYTIDILRKLKSSYQTFHGLYYSDEALEACARLSDRYITDRCLPDKAIDALDEAGSLVRMRANTVDHEGVPVVEAADVATVISQMTGIPVGKIAQGESRRLMNMASELKREIIGQDEAVDCVVHAIQRSRAGIKDPNRPIGSFLFFGPTGVGKTKLAKALAEYLFDDEDNLIRVDMSEYSEKFTSSRLVGAPPGYVGFDQGGQLSEQVRRKPYSVVLLDEIEKAHPDIFNLLLQILDEGRLTDNNGRSVNFKNTIVIMTSNVGSRELEDYGKGIGFATALRSLEADRKGVIEKAVKKTFPPEFVNRVDELVFFNSLSKEDLTRIIDIEITDLRARLRDAGFSLSISPAAKAFVAEAGYDPSYGARPLKRAIQKCIENPVSELIIADRLCSKTPKTAQKKRTIKVGCTKGSEELNIQIS